VSTHTRTPPCEIRHICTARVSQGGHLGSFTEEDAAVAAYAEAATAKAQAMGQNIVGQQLADELQARRPPPPLQEYALYMYGVRRVLQGGGRGRLPR
jgi:hypothetical protein